MQSKTTIKTITTLTNMITKLIKKELPTPVGRWRIEDCSMRMNNKVDLSNEDHCGPCGQYALEKVKKGDIVVVRDKNNDLHKA
jgi:hypothetical protein